MFPYNPNTKPFDETDIVKDREDIDIVGLYNPVVYMCLTLYRRRELSYEQALMSAVKFLATQNKNMFAELVKNQEERLRYPERFYSEK